MMLNILSLCILCLALLVSAEPNYPNFVPNARNVRTNGQLWRGLGHGSPTARSASRGSANPFGITVDNAFRQFNNNAARWANICPQDSDNDGFTNGEELCDPNCQSVGGNPACGAGKSLTHPGFPDIVNGDGEVVPDPNVAFSNELPEGGVLVHGFAMMFAWLVCAPVGILRAVFYKKRPGKPVWFRDHKVCMSAAVGFTAIGVIAVLSEEGLDPIEDLSEGDDGGSSGRHVLFGIVVVLVAIIQPISGYFRAHLPKPGEEKSFGRLLWEMQHQWTGRLGLLAGISAVYTGLDYAFVEGGGAAKFLAVVFALVGFGTVVYVLGFRDSHMERLKNGNKGLTN